MGKISPAPGEIMAGKAPVLSPSPPRPGSHCPPAPPASLLSFPPHVIRCSPNVPPWLCPLLTLASLPATVKEKNSKTCEAFVFRTKMRCPMSLVMDQWEAGVSGR